MIEIGAQFPQSGPIAWPNVQACLYPLFFFQGYKVRGFLPRHQDKCCFPIGIFQFQNAHASGQIH